MSVREILREWAAEVMTDEEYRAFIVRSDARWRKNDRLCVALIVVLVTVGVMGVILLITALIG